MKNLIKTSQRLVNAVQTNTFRYLFDKINWNDRLIMIKGARGVGKTTMLLQRIKKYFGANGFASTLRRATPSRAGKWEVSSCDTCIRYSETVTANE